MHVSLVKRKATKKAKPKEKNSIDLAENIFMLQDRQNRDEARVKAAELSLQPRTRPRVPRTLPQTRVAPKTPLRPHTFRRPARKSLTRNTQV